MASKAANTAEMTENREEAAEAPLLDTVAAAIKKMVARGKERGYVTYDELNAALPPDRVSSEQIEDTMTMLSELGINLIESEESEESGAVDLEDGDGETRGNVDDDDVGRTDDPVRMYLREMGSVELLSREGEIAIAKRIEAGRDMMIGGLCESPLTFRAIIAWHDALKAGRMLLRDIVDLEATQGGPTPGAVEADGPSSHDGEAPFDPPEELEDDDADGAGLSLSALEEKLKPQVLATFEEIETLYNKVQKLQRRRLDAITAAEEMNRRTERTYEKLRRELVQKVQQLCLHNNRVEELVQQLKMLNQQLTTLEGKLLRLAESCKVSREEFLKQYRGNELDPHWLERIAKLPAKGWKTFASKHADEINEIRSQIAAIAN